MLTEQMVTETQWWIIILLIFVYPNPVQNDQKFTNLVRSTTSQSASSATDHFKAIGHVGPVTEQSLLRRHSRAITSKGIETFESGKVEAVVNTTALLPCRPLKKSLGSSAWEEGTKGTLLWKRLSTNDYLIHDNRRLHSDTRYILDMSSFDQTIMDLRIDNVQRKDEGEYLCLYSTGQNVYKRRIDLIVLDFSSLFRVLFLLSFLLANLHQVPPIIYENSSSPVRVVVQEGDTTVLHCKAWGIPEPTLTWHSIPQDGPPRPISLTMDSRFHIGQNQLTIANVSRNLHGLYKCFATNGLQQTASRVMELDVHFPPTIKMANQKIGQSIHRTTMVRALIKGNPINAFYWEFERHPIHGPNSNCLIPMPNEKYCVSVAQHEKLHFMSTLSDQPYGRSTNVTFVILLSRANQPDKISSVKKEVKTTLFIANLTSEDFGSYTCVVETPFGIFRNSTEVFRKFQLLVVVYVCDISLSFPSTDIFEKGGNTITVYSFHSLPNWLIVPKVFRNHIK
ncbi:Septate junction protein [Fasciola gigantica]|uniref:Septate junction protein n=1 Tax=Fasciola gigantica TaxID=46835 RepID=A0A504YZM9_FASGI|nr:Septate junction protein [Fasciola gigantica]